MFERFDPGARQAIVDARNEAGRAGQDKLRTEHVLLGLLAEPGPAADALTAAGLRLTDVRARLQRGNRDGLDELDGEALSSLGIDLDAVRRATDAAFGPGALDMVMPPHRKRMPMADDAKQSLVRALRQAGHLGQRHINSGHLLLGIIDQPCNGALNVLAATGTDVAALRADVLRRLTAAA